MSLGEALNQIPMWWFTLMALVYLLINVYFLIDLSISDGIATVVCKLLPDPLTEKEKQAKYLEGFKKRHPGVYESTFKSTEIN